MVSIRGRKRSQTLRSAGNGEGYRSGSSALKPARPKTLAEALDVLAESQKSLSIIQFASGRIPQVGRSNGIPIVTEQGVSMSLAPTLKKGQWRLEVSETGMQTVPEATVTSLQGIIRRTAKIVGGSPTSGGKVFNIFFEGLLNA